MNFLSDNTATVCPELLDAIGEANSGPTEPYGEDAWTLRLDEVLGEFFGTEVRSFAVSTGTAANALAISSIVPPYGAVLAHELAHLVCDECGAPEFYTGGAKLMPLPGEHGKLEASTLLASLECVVPSVHATRVAALSVTQATESGTVYQPHELAELGSIAHRHGLKVHMDGTRFANAVAFIGCSPADITWRAGVDVLSLGATKNGALAAEAVVFFDGLLAEDFELRRKRAGHLCSKSRYLSAQLLAYVETGAWRRNAERSNRLAQKIARATPHLLRHAVEANEVFLRLGEPARRELRAAGFEFYDWGPRGSGEVRFVVSWDQPEKDVEALVAALRRLGWAHERVS